MVDTGSKKDHMILTTEWSDGTNPAPPDAGQCMCDAVVVVALGPLLEDALNVTRTLKRQHQTPALARQQHLQRQIDALYQELRKVS